MTLTDHTPITLKEASEIFFGGRVSVLVLKTQHAKGNLDMAKIGRSYFTTIAKLRQMEERCRVEVPAQGSGSTKSETRGRSSTDEADIAQGSALRKLSELKEHFGITSKESTGRSSQKRRSLPT